ncbi:MAG: hypothetical protein ACWGHV_12790 [Stutzerimonas stutzeri]
MVGAIVFELLIGIEHRGDRRAARGGFADKLLMVVSFVGVSAPQFIVAMLRSTSSR